MRPGQIKEACGVSDLDGVRVAVLGGDQREVILVAALLRRGAQVTVAGYPPLPQIADARRAGGVVEAVTGVDAVIAPMSNTDEAGEIKARLDPSVRLVLDDAAFRAIGPGKTLYIGVAKPVVAMLASRHRVRLVETAEVDEIAILNSIPTAEGAIQRAMEQLPVTLHGSRVVVVGFGRCGVTLARMLGGIGARVRVVARDAAQRARAYEMGFEAEPMERLPQSVADARAVFNTVPALLITRRVLEAMRRDVVVIDVAQAPGGVDFEAAKELGIKAFLDLGIPGRVAPETAGEILARVIPQLILDDLLRSRV